MANTTISMSKIRKILRMFSNGRSIMSISAQADASRNTVKKYLASFKESGFTFEEVDALSDKELEDLLGKAGNMLLQGVFILCYAAFPMLTRSLNAPV